MKKRGQVTLFIILGIVIVLLIGLGIYFSDELFSVVGISAGLSYPSEVQEVVDHVQECVDESAYNAVTVLALQGGYSSFDGVSAFVFSDAVYIPYYLDNGTLNVISSRTMAVELGSYYDSLMGYCLDLDMFSEFEFEAGDMETEVVVNNNSVEFVMEYAITAYADEVTSYDMNEPYETVVNANLGWMRDVAENIATYDATAEYVDFDFLLDQGLVDIQLAPFNNDTIVYILKDDTSFEGVENFTFMFAEYFPGLNITEEVEEEFE